VVVQHRRGAVSSLEQPSGGTPEGQGQGREGGEEEEMDQGRIRRPVQRFASAGEAAVRREGPLGGIGTGRGT
jgi:hypothetical protein